LFLHFLAKTNQSHSGDQLDNTFLNLFQAKLEDFTGVCSSSMKSALMGID